jgi:hypothetical protein
MTGENNRLHLQLHLLKATISELHGGPVFITMYNFFSKELGFCMAINQIYKVYHC